MASSSTLSLRICLLVKPILLVSPSPQKFSLIGGVHKWWYPHFWMVYNEQSEHQTDFFPGYPHISGTPISGYFLQLIGIFLLYHEFIPLVFLYPKIWHRGFQDTSVVAKSQDPYPTCSTLHEGEMQGACRAVSGDAAATLPVSRNNATLELKMFKITQRWSFPSFSV